MVLLVDKACSVTWSVSFVMLLVLLQSDKDEGSIMTGSKDSSSSMGVSRDKKLARLTAWVGAIFVVLTIATSTIMLHNIK